MNIVFCTDENYFDYTLVSIISVIENNDINNLNIFLFTDKKYGKIDAINNYYKREIIKLIIVDNSIFDSEVDMNLFNYSYSLFYRIIIPEILNIDKVIYLDADIICLRNLDELWNTDIKCCGAIRNNKDYDYFTEKYGNKMLNDTSREKGDYKLYFNSGVLLINCDYWRKNKITNKLFERIRNYPDLCFDQDALNEVLKNDVEELPLTYNFHVKYYYEETNYLYDPHILHWASKYKPWENLCWNTPWVIYYNKLIIDINCFGYLNCLEEYKYFGEDEYSTIYKDPNCYIYYIVAKDIRYYDLLNLFYEDIYVEYVMNERYFFKIYKTSKLKDIIIPDDYIYFSSPYYKKSLNNCKTELNASNFIIDRKAQKISITASLKKEDIKSILCVLRKTIKRYNKFELKDKKIKIIDDDIFKFKNTTIQYHTFPGKIKIRL